MPNPSGLAVTKPISAWNKPFKTNFKNLFKALGKAGVDAATGQWVGLGKDAVDALSAIGLDSKEPTELSWALIYNALSRAMFGLVAESQFLMTELPVDIETLSEQLDLSLESSDLQITADFFDHPEQLSVVSRLQIPLKQWLVGVGISDIQSEVLSNRLPAYFTFALNEEWRRNAPTYAGITASVKTPFTEATEREQGWRLYGSWLQKQIQEPMMFEAFGLKDVYIPLRAYFKRQQNSQIQSSNKGYGAAPKNERVVVDLAAALRAWIRTANRQDAIRVISGGPGAGKSSFAKIFAADHAQEGKFPVLFVPLHQFSPSGDLEKAVGEFIRYDHYLKDNPLDPENEGLRLLVIFDGLDELAMQGKLAKETAQAFVREVQAKVNLFNLRALRLQVIITGREVVVQDSFREPHHILHALPYFVSEDNRKESKLGDEPYIDPNELLSEDQRSDWWWKYGLAIQRDYTAMPEVLNVDTLAEITAQPLLNYLVALSYVAGKLTISETTNLNTVYADLLDAVYERGYEGSGRHRAIASMTKAHFIQVLEEIALAAWHGDGRTTTIQEIELHCERSGLRPLLDAFEEGAEAGVTRLLAAFYFRQSGARSTERTFEFTHKSFGEYLTARRIVRAMARIQKQLEYRQKDMEEGWGELDALHHWAEVCGPTRMDGYLLNFLRDEVALSPSEDVAKWQKTFGDLIGVMLRQGMPMERLEPPLRFHEATQRAIYAEEALLVVLNACSQVTKDISIVDWPLPESFGAWMGRLQGQRTNRENVVSLDCLGRLDLSTLVLVGRDFHMSNLREANLFQADLGEVNLREANLFQADLGGANLREAKLIQADLGGATLREANLKEANLVEAKLRAANLFQARLFGAYLGSADLSGADLHGANLDAANVLETQFGSGYGLSAEEKLDLVERGGIFDEGKRESEVG